MSGGSGRRSLNPRRPERVDVNTELTPELHRLLVQTREESMLFDEQVALKCGVERETLRRWLQLGVLENAEPRYAAFTKEWADAKLAVEEQALADVQAGDTGKMGSGDWKSRAWFLERFQPGRWGKNVPAAGPREDINLQTVLESVDQRKLTLLELLDDPPPELESALRAKRERILQILDTPSESASEPLAIAAGRTGESE